MTTGIRITIPPPHGQHEPPTLESIPGLDTPIELPIAAEEVSPFAERLERFETSRSGLLDIIAEKFAANGEGGDRRAEFVTAKVAYMNAYASLIAVMVDAYDDIDDLVRATAHITNEDIDDRYKAFTLLSDKFDPSDKPARIDVARSHDDEADEHLSEDGGEVSPAAFVNCLTGSFRADVEDSLLSIGSLLPNEPSPEAPPLRTQLLHTLGATATKALTIAAGVAAGMIIADRFRKR